MAVLPERSISIRKADQNDVASISNLGTYAFSLSFGHSVQPHELQAYLDEAYSIEAIGKDTSDPTKDTIVATDDTGEVVGFALLTKGTTEPCISHIQNYVELQRIYVQPAMHGGGVGKLLARATEALATEQGFEYMWLGVWEENFKAQKFYEKLGYKVVGQHDFDIGGVVQTDLIMLKQLEQR